MVKLYLQKKGKNIYPENSLDKVHFQNKSFDCSRNHYFKTRINSKQAVKFPEIDTQLNILDTTNDSKRVAELNLNAKTKDWELSANQNAKFLTVGNSKCSSPTNPHLVFQNNNIYPRTHISNSANRLNLISNIPEYSLANLVRNGAKMLNILEKTRNVSLMKGKDIFINSEASKKVQANIKSEYITQKYKMLPYRKFEGNGFIPKHPLAELDILLKSGNHLQKLDKRGRTLNKISTKNKGREKSIPVDLSISMEIKMFNSRPSPSPVNKCTYLNLSTELYKSDLDVLNRKCEKSINKTKN